MVSLLRKRIGNGWYEHFKIPESSSITNAWHFLTSGSKLAIGRLPLLLPCLQSPTLALRDLLQLLPLLLPICSQRSKYHEHITDLAPQALVPFPIMSQHSLKQAEKSGGVCFHIDASNVGGQGVGALGPLNCDARATAGAAYLPDVLHNLFTQFQPSCTAVNQTMAHKINNHWPSVYIAKFDIQGFEFQALAPAIPWLEERPPCYMVLEFSNEARQNYALMELLVSVVGYDSVWRSSGLHMIDNASLYGQPPSTPHWSKQNGTELWAFHEKDMDGQADWAYINYIFGFADQDACVKRLLGHT
jgi:hypothetical protein